MSLKFLGEFAVDNTIAPLEDPLSAYDETGTAKIVAKVTKSFRHGKQMLKLIGNNTHTVVKLPVRVKRK